MTEKKRNNAETNMPALLQQLVIWHQNDPVKIGKLEPPVDGLLPMLETGCTIFQLADKALVDSRKLHELLLFMTNKGWIMQQPKDNIHVQ